MRLAHLDRSAPHPHDAGIVLLQIDGLSRTQFEHALARRRMPFLRNLLRRQHYVLKPFYPGQPSSTPAVQAEILYGVRCAVPAFQFYRRTDNEVFTMYDARCAKAIAEILTRTGSPLLAPHGSSYCNIYSGGADNIRFCAETMDAQSFFGDTTLWRRVVLLGLYSPLVLRLVGLCVLEFGIAFVDFLRGVLVRGEDVLREFGLISSRVFLVVGVREFIVHSAKVDVARGVPVIHANFLGYDEQAHRRGPRSLFAHWTLKGIDRAIEDIYRTARRSQQRDYQIVIYSDHGQENAEMYERRYGKPIEEAVVAAFSGTPVTRDEGPTRDDFVRSRSRALLRGCPQSPPPAGPAPSREEIQITAMGPVGHVYLPGSAEIQARAYYAHLLATEAHVPMVLIWGEDDRVTAYTDEGHFDLCDEAQLLLGNDHPYLDLVAKDLANLVRQKDAGDLVLIGWRAGRRPMTFARENGSHGGPAPEETNAFCLMPDHSAPNRPFLRPGDLHDWVRAQIENYAPDAPVRPVEPDRLRVATYNVHGCRGLDGKILPRRIASVLRALGADLVALQEVDVGRPRSRRENQAAWIAHELGMHYAFFPVIERHGEQYGVAILSRFPMREVKRGHLPYIEAKRPREMRGALWVAVGTPLGRIHFVNTHLSLNFRERVQQAKALVGPQWLGSLSPSEPVILAGDFNAVSSSPAFRVLATRLKDAHREACPSGLKPTFYSGGLLLRIDHILTSPHLLASDAIVPLADYCRQASDHLPLCVELRAAAGGPIPPAKPGAPDERNAMAEAPHVKEGRSNDGYE